MHSDFSTMILDTMQDHKPIKFKVVGLITSVEYQKCKSYITRLHQSLPDEIAQPDLRPMLSFDWEEFLIKIRRKIGGEGTWSLSKSVAVFVDNKFLGDEDRLMKYLNCRRLKLGIYKDFYCQADLDLREHINSSDRDYIYLEIEINKHVVGTLLVMLYTDLTPDTCNNFMRLCFKKHRGLRGAPVHRIVKDSWIQIGGYNMKPKRMACENYCVAHDRRGILAMCNRTKHTDNSTQFLISLNPQPWMTYFYVAFGQVVHGNDVLTRIENIPTNYEAPTIPIKIVQAGKFTFDWEVPKSDKTLIESYLKSKDPVTKVREDVLDPRCVDSIMSPVRYKNGLYFLPTDLESHLPLRNLGGFVLSDASLENCIIPSEIEEELIDNDYEPTQKDAQFFDELRSGLFYTDVDTPTIENYPVYDFINRSMDNLYEGIVPFNGDETQLQYPNSDYEGKFENIDTVDYIETSSTIPPNEFELVSL